MIGGKKLLDEIKINLKNRSNDEILPVYINVFDNSLSKKWLAALKELVDNQYHLEKNYCFFGFVESERGQQYLLDQINLSIQKINESNIGYTIDDFFSVDNTIIPGPWGHGIPGGGVQHDKMNTLHRYFEDLQGTSGHLSPYYLKADTETRWHIRQLNLLCHEYESLVLSIRKAVLAPEWQRVSQLMCWLNSPRFLLDEEDLELFGVETINRPLGGVYVGVNKAVGKHHWEVFNDEGRDIDQLISTTMRGQTEAAGDFDIEWSNDPGKWDWQKKKLDDFRDWLIRNGFDPMDKSLTIGHPQVGQVDLIRSFNTSDYQIIWNLLNKHLDVWSIEVQGKETIYDYHWKDDDFVQRQLEEIERNNKK